VNITSAAGFMAAPGMSAYASSKFALEGFSDSLRREMYPLGITVSIVSPGFMNTHIVRSAMEPWKRSWNSIPEETKLLYGQQWFDSHINEQASELAKVSVDPQITVDDLLHAVTNSRPELRCRPGIQAKFLFCVSMLPTTLTDALIRFQFRNKPRPAHHVDSGKAKKAE